MDELAAGMEELSRLLYSHVIRYGSLRLALESACEDIMKRTYIKIRTSGTLLKEKIPFYSEYDEIIVSRLFKDILAHIESKVEWTEFEVFLNQGEKLELIFKDLSNRRDERKEVTKKDLLLIKARILALDAEISPDSDWISFIKISIPLLQVMKSRN